MDQAFPLTLSPQEVARHLLPIHVTAFASTCKAWRAAASHTVTGFVCPFAGDVTLPSGQPGAPRLEVLRTYLQHVSPAAGQGALSAQQPYGQRRWPTAGHTSHASGRAVGLGPDASSSNGLPEAVARAPGAAAAEGAGVGGQELVPAARLPNGIAPPLLERLVQRFPAATHLNLHRGLLDHPAYEAGGRAASECTESAGGHSAAGAALLPTIKGTPHSNPSPTIIDTISAARSIRMHTRVSTLPEPPACAAVLPVPLP